VGFLFDKRGLAEVFIAHGQPAASAAHIFHFLELAFAHMGGVRIGSAAETAGLLVIAGIAQMPRAVRDGAAGFTCIGHIFDLLVSALRGRGVCFMLPFRRSLYIKDESVSEKVKKHPYRFQNRAALSARFSAFWDRGPIFIIALTGIFQYKNQISVTPPTRKAPNR
jgi:hypothetical protein